MDYRKHVTIYRTHIMSNGCYIGQFLKQIWTISFIPNSIWPNQLKHNTTTHRLTQQSWQNKTHAAQKRTAWTTQKKTRVQPCLCPASISRITRGPNWQHVSVRGGHRRLWRWVHLFRHSALPPHWLALSSSRKLCEPHPHQPWKLSNRKIFLLKKKPHLSNVSEHLLTLDI